MSGTPNQMIGAICSRSNDEGRGTEMRRFAESTERDERKLGVQKLTESAEGRRLVTHVKAQHARLAAAVKGAPVGTIAPHIRTELESILEQLDI